MLVEKATIKNLHCVRFNTGDELLKGLEDAVKKQGIQNGLILYGFGSTVNHHFHVVGNAEIPPENVFEKADKPSDIVNINGAVINGRVHAHIIHSDRKIAYGGHLEPGVKALTFCMVFIAETDQNLGEWDSGGKEVEEKLKKK